MHRDLIKFIIIAINVKISSYLTHYYEVVFMILLIYKCYDDVKVQDFFIFNSDWAKQSERLRRREKWISELKTGRISEENRN